MHVLTSSIFLPSVLSLLPSRAHQVVFLQTYLVAACHTALARGRPHIDVGLIMDNTASPSKGSEEEAKVGNPWCGLIEASLDEPGQSTLQRSPAIDLHRPPSPPPLLTVSRSGISTPDSHTPKSLRTLLHLASLPHLSLAAPGQLPHTAGSTLPGIEALDGSVFVRIAGMVMEQQAGWGKAGGKRRDWGRIAPGWDKAWEGVE